MIARAGKASGRPASVLRPVHFGRKSGAEPSTAYRLRACCVASLEAEIGAAMRHRSGEARMG